jgi:5-methylcytosine-specific restriction endonuclease McrA
MSWVKKLRKLVPIVSLSVELTKFDTQKMQKSNISGVEYQQGTLAGYEVREYLLEKWQRKCAYCGKEGVYMNIDHIQPKSKGGSDRVSNLCLSCVKCNHKKDNKLVEEFLKRKPELLARINRQRKVPLDDAAAMNATRNGLLRELEATGLPVEIGTGAETKWNRSKLGIPKGHAADAACVGKVEGLVGWGMKVFKIKAVGRGQYRRTNVYKSGFPRGYLTRNKVIYGFKTGDMVVARVSSGKYRGVWKGRVVVKKDGWFNIGKCCTLYDNCKLISYGNGYSYN